MAECWQHWSAISCNRANGRLLWRLESKTVLSSTETQIVLAGPTLRITLPLQKHTSILSCAHGHRPLPYDGKPGLSSPTLILLSVSWAF